MTDPIPMRLPCPACGVMHVDEGEFATKPHHTHACQECGMVWRPAIVHTVGVLFLPGYRNEVPSPEVRPNRPTLTARWLELANSWPSDGWVGAGRARASHAEKVRGTEAMLAHVHGTTSHGPFVVDGSAPEDGKSARCICGKRMVPTIENAEHIEDPRLIRFSRPTRRYEYVSEIIA